MGRVRSGVTGPVLAALAALVVVLLVACGGGDDDEARSDTADRLLERLPGERPGGVGPSGTEPNPVDACQLLTDAEVNQATGGEVDKRTAGAGTGGDPSCTWEVLYGKDEATRTNMTVIVYGAGQITFDADRDAPGSEAVSGVGDGAYWQAPVSVLNVLAGTRNLTVQVVDAAGRLPRAAKDVAVDLARAALVRL